MTSTSLPSADDHAKNRSGTSELTGGSGSAAVHLVPSFCPACGHSFESSSCPVSHDMTPTSDDIGVGRIVTFRRGLRRRTAVVVGIDGAATVVVEVGRRGEHAQVKVKDVADATDWAAVPSPLYRLEALGAMSEWSSSVVPWLEENRETLLATIGDRRSFALAAIGAGDLALARTSGLSASEITWLKMHTQRNVGDLRRAFRAALDLDPKSYPDHALVLLEAIGAYNSLLDDQALRDHVRNLDQSYPGWILLATAVLDDLSIPPSTVDGDLDRFGASAAASLVRDVASGTGSVVANAWSRAVASASVSPGDLEDLSIDFPEITDELIDLGRLEQGPLSSDAPPYLRARIDIASVSDADLREVGAVRELARRAYVAGDRQALKKLVEQSPAEARYFQALDDLRRREVPEDVPDDDLLKAVAASIRSGRAHPNALADASTWQVLSGLIVDEDVEGYPEQAAAWQLERALADLAVWDFDSALTRARSALKWSDEEAIRDEALNVIGFVLYQQGSDEPAITAIAKALEGEYSANLQANIGVVAADLQPEIAAAHMGRLAKDAPTVDLQLAAVRHAFGIWATTSDAWDDDELVLPEDLRSTFRTLVVADIPYDDYVTLVQLLARADAGWLTAKTNTQKGPHAGSAARSVYTAKASHDPSDYVDALATVSKQHVDEEWFADEKNNFVESLRSLIFSEEGSIGPASYAFAAIDAGLELDDFDYVTLASGAAISIFGAIASDEGLPSDKIKDMVVEAQRRARLLDEEQLQLVDPLVALAGNRYGVVVATFHAKVHDEIVDALRSMAVQLYGVPRRRVNWQVVGNAVRPMRTQLNDSAKDVAEANTMVSDTDLYDSLRELAAGLRELASKISEPRRFFS